MKEHLRSLRRDISLTFYHTNMFSYIWTTALGIYCVLSLSLSQYALIQNYHRQITAAPCNLDNALSNTAVLIILQFTVQYQ